jgi:two-component system response regulator
MGEIRHILLADDNPYDVELVKEAFMEFNFAYNVVVVNDGVETLDYLRYEGKYEDRDLELPDVLLLDIKMPRMDGLEVLKILRNDIKLQNLPVVMLTSSRQEGDLIQSYELGSNAYIVKPINFFDFIETVKQIGIFWGTINESPYGEGKKNAITD